MTGISKALLNAATGLYVVFETHLRVVDQLAFVKFWDKFSHPLFESWLLFNNLKSSMLIWYHKTSTHQIQWPHFVKQSIHFWLEFFDLFELVLLIYLKSEWEIVDDDENLLHPVVNLSQISLIVEKNHLGIELKPAVRSLFKSLLDRLWELLSLYIEKLNSQEIWLLTLVPVDYGHVLIVCKFNPILRKAKVLTLMLIVKVVLPNDNGQVFFIYLHLIYLFLLLLLRDSCENLGPLLVLFLGYSGYFCYDIQIKF